MIKAVIDVGTNSTRLYVARTEGIKQEKILKMLSTTRLGEGILSSSRMGDVPLARTTDAIRDFASVARENGADEIFIYATAVVRESSNKDEFIRLVEEKTGITPHIIPGSLEGEIAFIGAAGEHPCPAVIDIGGGSTEIVTKHNGILKALSLKTGGVRLKEQFETPSGIVDTDTVKSFVKEKFVPQYKDKTDILSAKTLVGVSGTPTTLLSLILGLKSYCPDKIQDVCVSRRDLEAMLKELALMSSSQRQEFTGDFAPRADIIVFGGAMLIAVMEYYGFESLTVSDRDSLEGYLALKING